MYKFDIFGAGGSMIIFLFCQGRTAAKRSLAAGSLSKQPKQDLSKDDGKSGKAIGRTVVPFSASDRDLPTHHPFEGRQGATVNVISVLQGNGNTNSVSAKGSTSSTRSSDIHGSELKSESGAVKSSDLRFPSVKDDGNEVSDLQRQASSRPVQSPRHEAASSKSNDKPHKRVSPAEELDRLSKRRKGEIDSRDLEADVRFSDRERSIDPRGADKLHPADLEKTGSDDQINRTMDRSKDKANERYDRDYRERLERPEKSRGDDNLSEKSRDRSMERYGRERSVDRLQERGGDRGSDRLTEKSKDERNKDDRSKSRYNETSQEKSHADDRFHGQSLPPPPPLPAHMVPQSVNAGRRDDDGDRRLGTARHTQRLSPRHDDRERRRSEEENILISQDDAKRRREDEFRDRKREERDGFSVKVCFFFTCVVMTSHLPYKHGTKLYV